jgi:hypothetical protein
VLRENLVGVIIEFVGDNDQAAESLLLVEFKGEGAESVVYTFAKLEDLSKADWVIKFPKNAPWLEMETLHHSLRVHEELYPDHPLRMSAAARLEMLTDEMLARIDYGHLVFRIELYRDLLGRSVDVLARSCAEAFERGEPLGPILDNSPADNWVDDNLLQYLEDLLDEDMVIEERRSLIEALVDEIPSTIQRRQAAGKYFPLSRNPLVNLVGLHAEGFISEDELRSISRSPGFVGRLLPQHPEGLFDLIATLYFYLRSQLESDVAAVAESAKSSVSHAISACDLLADVAHAQVLGRARLWKAYLLLLVDTPYEVIEPLATSALDLLDGPDCLADRHDALMLLAGLCADLDPARSTEYDLEAQQIRRELGVD